MPNRLCYGGHKMPNLNFGPYRYQLTDALLRRLFEMAIDSGKIELEKGADLCGDPLQSLQRWDVSRVGPECTGTSCSVHITDCKRETTVSGYPSTSIGNFHTHPTTVVPTSNPSWGDLYSALWRRTFEGQPALSCRVGVSEGRPEVMRCDHPRQSPSQEQIDALSKDWDKMLHAPETSFPLPELFYQGKNVQWPDWLLKEHEERLEQEPSRTEQSKKYLDKWKKENDDIIDQTTELEKLTIAMDITRDPDIIAHQEKRMELACELLDVKLVNAETDAGHAEFMENECATSKCYDKWRQVRNLADMVQAEIPRVKHRFCYKLPEPQIQPTMSVGECEERYSANELKTLARNSGLNANKTNNALCRDLLKKGIIGGA